MQRMDIYFNVKEHLECGMQRKDKGIFNTNNVR